ncbi:MULTISPECIES: hypothetical protein [Rufibacter]|uniref:Uncharacterized protein n=1 Tax=Rufibacter quisquiliarum TaxID=1549639 RepID=A0A839GKY3_9BACT|nr:MULTISPECIES: hypothetical protein [Rufibacter]MBA9076245.1 hypothetical protein [Rufibacter quisquiliarum]
MNNYIIIIDLIDSNKPQTFEYKKEQLGQQRPPFVFARAPFQDTAFGFANA